MATRQSRAMKDAPIPASLPTPLEYCAAQYQATAEAPVISASSLGELADFWLLTQNERLAADKVAAALKAKEEQAKQILLHQMQLQGITGIGGKTVRVGMDPEPEYQPHVKDWEAFYKYILKTKDFSLLERRPGKAACRERWADDKEVPGVEKFPVYKLTKQKV